MAPTHSSKLTIHPWLDAPLYNRIRYPQWKIYLYNAAQRLCTSLDPTGAYCLVARDSDWETHPKNITPSRPPTPGGTLHPAAIRARPVFQLPPFYALTATTYRRELWKLEKETFEKFDEAETILHTAIVESLSQGTIRTINLQHPAGIASLSALQLVEIVHGLYSTPTLQDITTVENDLKRPLLNFEDFMDHVTDHINHYESLRSFNQQVANITKIQTFKDSIQRWPQFDAIIATWEMDNNNIMTRNFTSFTDFLVSQYGNLPVDTKPRGGHAYNAQRKGKKGKGKGKGNGKGKPAKGKGRGGGRFVYWDENDVPAAKRPRNERQASSAVNDSDATMDSREEDTSSVRSHTTVRSTVSSVNQVHGNNTTTPPTTSESNPDPKKYYYCNYHGWNLSHDGPQCRVLLNDNKYTRAQHEATSPGDTTPWGNMHIEPGRDSDNRKRHFLKSWGTYTH